MRRESTGDDRMNILKDITLSDGWILLVGGLVV